MTQIKDENNRVSLPSDDDSGDDDLQCISIVPYRDTERPDTRPQRREQRAYYIRPDDHQEKLEEIARDMFGRCTMCGKKHFGGEEFCQDCGNRTVA